MIIVLAAIVVVIVIIAVAVLIYSPSKSSNNLPYGLKGGDYFIYDATGTYNNTSISGYYNLTLVGNITRNLVGGYSGLYSTIPQLNHMMNNNDKLDLMTAQGWDVGVGKIGTPFGIKEVFQVFQDHDGWAVVYYQGSDPLVVYGCAVNGPNFHLDLVLNQTNNQYVIDNNTSSLELQNQPPTQSGRSITCMIAANSSFSDLCYFPNGANLTCNLTGQGSNLYCFNEANIMSMAEGGPYAYDIGMTKLDITNVTENAVVPSGYYTIVVYNGNSTGMFNSFAEAF